MGLKQQIDGMIMVPFYLKEHLVINWLFKKSVPTDFQNIMRRAELLVAQQNAEGLKDLIKLVLKPIQSRHLLDAYIKDDHKAIHEIGLDSDFGFRSFITVSINGNMVRDRTFSSWLHSEECLVSNSQQTLSFATDIILPTPWHPQSIIANLGKIGKGRQNGPFKQSSNHSVLYIYPLMLGLVHGGNHSIMQGILDGGGEIKPTEVCDISCLLPAVFFDGKDWISTHSGYRVGTPIYPEFGWVWEIAKKLVEVQTKKETNLASSNIT